MLEPGGKTGQVKYGSSRYRIDAITEFKVKPKWRWIGLATVSVTSFTDEDGFLPIEGEEQVRANAIGLANAHLIAAAPELLAACKAFVTAWDKSHQLEKTDVAWRLALRLALQAIAKAEGKP